MSPAVPIQDPSTTDASLLEPLQLEEEEEERIRSRLQQPFSGKNFWLVIYCFMLALVIVSEFIFNVETKFAIWNKTEEIVSKLAGGNITLFKKL